MKSLTFALIIMVLASCNRDVARTSDFILFNKLKQDGFKSSVKGRILKGKIYGSGTKWIDKNIEGRKYQLPFPCTKKDLDLYFAGKRLQNAPSDTDNKGKQKVVQQMEIKFYSNEGEEPVDSFTKDKESPKVGQYSFFNFIDHERVVFVSNNRVRYNKYTPEIKAEKFNMDLGKVEKSNPYQRGYYRFENDTVLVVELRQYKNVTSKLLFFKFVKNQLVLEKIQTFKWDTVNKLKRKYEVQVSDLEILLAENLPDIESLPVAFEIDKKVGISFKSLNGFLISEENWTKFNVRIVLSGKECLREFLDDDQIKHSEQLDPSSCLSW